MKNISSHFIARSVLGVAAALAIGSADADTIDLGYTVGSGSTTTGPTSIDTEFFLTLNTVDGSPATSFSVAPGDVVDATISFNPSASIAIPSNAAYTVAHLLLQGTGFDGNATGTSNDSATVTLGGNPAGGSGAFQYQSCTTSGQLCDAGIGITGGTAVNFSFDTYTTAFTVSTLDSSVNINSGIFQVYTAIAAVPEPQSCALMAVGLGMLGLVAVRRRKGSAAMRFARTA